MALIQYKASATISANGFINPGSTCYFNALLQSMLSCTSFIENILECKINNTQNSIIKLLIQFIDLSMECKKLDKTNSSHILTISKIQKKLNTYAYKIWKCMVVKLCNRKKIPIKNFMQGQQCVGEGYHYLLETIEEFQKIQNLFIHKYKSLIRCLNCDKWVSDIECTYNLFEVDPDLKLDQLPQFDQYNTEPSNMNEFISKQTGYVDKDYICPDCKQTGEKFRMDVLVMIPEILVVMSKKYKSGRKLNLYTDFPEKLVFKNNNGSNMVYEAVSQIEHSGNLHSGHYWAKCKRNDGWYDMNDLNISASKFQPTNNTYVVFYHLI